MSTLTGLGAALRLTVRRNWVFWTLWIVGLAMLMPATASQYDVIIPPGTDPRATIEPLIHNPTMQAILGPAFDLYDKGGFVFWRSGGFTTVLAGLMTGFGIIRATRAEEEAGRVELLRSGPLGRHAPLAAAVLVGLLACLLTGALNAVLLIALDLRVAGAAAAGLAITTTGAIYLGVGAVAAQVFETARTARSWAVGIGLGGAYLLRAIVDGSVNPDLEPLRWAIPLEWGMLSRPFADERWWVFALSAGLAALLIGLAFWLEARRDHGAGLRPASLGRAAAAPGLRSAWGLARRLQRGSIIGWTLSLVISAIAFGSIAAGMEDVFTQNPEMGVILQRMGGTDQLEMAFYIGILAIMIAVVAVMAVSMLNVLHLEENRGHAEAMLATATSRTGFALSHLLLALLVPSLVLLAVGAGLPLAQAAQDANWSLVSDYLGTAAAMWPGLVLVVGIAMALIGWVPRAFALSWAVLGWSIFCSWFAILFDLPQWLVKAQPWGHLTAPPRDEMDWLPFAIELAIGLALIVLGLVGYRRRDIATN